MIAKVSISAHPIGSQLILQVPVPIIEFKMHSAVSRPSLTPRFIVLEAFPMSVKAFMVVSTVLHPWRAGVIGRRARARIYGPSHRCPAPRRCGALGLDAIDGQRIQRERIKCVGLSRIELSCRNRHELAAHGTLTLVANADVRGGRIKCENRASRCCGTSAGGRELRSE